VNPGNELVSASYRASQAKPRETPKHPEHATLSEGEDHRVRNATFRVAGAGASLSVSSQARLLRWKTRPWLRSRPITPVAHPLAVEGVFVYVAVLAFSQTGGGVLQRAIASPTRASNLLATRGSLACCARCIGSSLIGQRD